MLKELQKHRLAYFILAIFLLLGLVLFLGAWPDRKLQRLVAASIAGFYFIWGLASHVQSRQLTRRIVLEYLAVSLVAGLMMVLITF